VFTKIKQKTDICRTGYAKFCSETLYFAVNVLVFAVHKGQPSCRCSSQRAAILSLQFTKGSHLVVAVHKGQPSWCRWRRTENFQDSPWLVFVVLQKSIN